MIFYKFMDPANPPEGIKLVICPCCKRPARVGTEENPVAHIHTARIVNHRLVPDDFCMVDAKSNDEQTVTQ